MSRRRSRRRSEKARRRASPKIAEDVSRVVVREATRVERLAYTRTQAAAALGISRSTFIRRVLPFVETIETGWGTRLVPVDEVERFVSERRGEARADRTPPGRPGRKIALPAEIVARIRDEHSAGKSLGKIARDLNADACSVRQPGNSQTSGSRRAGRAPEHRHARPGLE